MIDVERIEARVKDAERLKDLREIELFRDSRAALEDGRLLDLVESLERRIAMLER